MTKKVITPDFAATLFGAEELIEYTSPLQIRILAGRSDASTKSAQWSRQLFQPIQR
ncbi:MAG: hypothetical protein Q8L53_05420 [Aestuariivirga sp.]|nr:hypothetical protein [Aestuariivirga sp.]